MIHDFCRFLCRVFIFLLWRREVVGREHLIEEGGALVVANHQSFLDPPAIGSVYRSRLHYLARETLFRGFFAWLLPRIHAVPVARGKADMGSMKRIIRLLQSGEKVLLFPEGTRSPDGGLQKAEAGVGFLIAKCGVPVQPARISGSHEAWPKERKWPRPHRLRVHYGPPIDFSGVGEGLRGRDLYAAYADKVMEEIGKLG